MSQENALVMMCWLQPWRRTILLGEETILIISTSSISIKDRASSIIKECIGLNGCKIRGPRKRRGNPLFKNPCFNIWPKMIRERSYWSLN